MREALRSEKDGPTNPDRNSVLDPQGASCPLDLYPFMSCTLEYDSYELV